MGDIAHTQYNDRNEGIKRNFYKGQELIEDAIPLEYIDFNNMLYD